MISNEFTTVYPSRGTGLIHANGCPAIADAKVTRRTTPATLYNGLAEIAPCCKHAEPRMFALVRGRI